MRRSAILAKLTLLLSPLFAAPLAAQDHADHTGNAILIENATVIPMDRETRLVAQDVLVKDGRIVQVAPHGTIEPAADTRRYDGSGLFLMPGLRDSHVHLTTPVSSREASNLSEDETRKLVERRMKTMLSYGIVAVRDPGMKEKWVPLATELRAREDLPGLRFAGPLIDGSPTQWTSKLEVFVERPQEGTEVANRLADSGVDFFKIYNRVSPDVFASVTAVAREREVPVAGHVPFQVTTRDAVTLGMREIEHSYVNLFKDCVAEGNDAPGKQLGAWIREGYEGRWRVSSEMYRSRNVAQCEALYRLMGESSVFLTATPQLDLPLGLIVGEDELASLAATAREGCRVTLDAQAEADPAVVAAWKSDLAELYADLRRAGVTMVAGSDAPTDCMGYGAALIASTKLFAQLGLSNFEALESATTNAALLAGQEGAGIIADSAPADLILVGADPLADLDALSDLRAVMLGGKWVE